MGIEKLLPKPSSFLPGGLAVNVIEHYDIVLKKYHPVEKVHKGNKIVGVVSECLRDIPTVVFMYYSDNWNMLTPIALYVGFTWFMDRWSYHGMGGI
jgi:hypothetical protein